LKIVLNLSNTYSGSLSHTLAQRGTASLPWITAEGRNPFHNKVKRSMKEQTCKNKIKSWRLLELFLAFQMNQYFKLCFL